MNNVLFRKRSKIMDDAEEQGRMGETCDYQILETLLDIRDLLANPPVEISGEPLPTPLT